jgi:hypothetical protein
VALGLQPHGDWMTSLGTLHTFDFEEDKFIADPAGGLATRLLLAHFSLHWSSLVILNSPYNDINLSNNFNM